MHHIEKTIILKLGFNDSLRFSELKTEGLENKLFDYHLKIVVRDGYVQKNIDGQYLLTRKGKQWGIRAQTEDKTSAKAHSVLFLVVRRKSDDAWLLYKRLVHPLKDKQGFMHASPLPGVSATDVASRELTVKTGLTADFKVLGSGYFTMLSAGEVESFTHFELLASDDCSGTLTPGHERAEYYWDTNPNWNSADMLPNMLLLVDKYEQGTPFFSEQTYDLCADPENDFFQNTVS